MSILPEPFAQAIKHHEFIPAGTLHARRLYDTPQIAHLKKLNSIETDPDDMVWALINNAVLQVLRSGDEKATKEYILSSLYHIYEFFSKRIPPDQQERKDKFYEAVLTIDREMSIPAAAWLIRKTMSMSIGDVDYTIFKDSDQEQVMSKKDVSIFADIPLYNTEDGTLYYIQVCNVLAWSKQDMRRSWIQESNVQAAILRANGYDVKRIECIMIFKDWFQSRQGNYKDYPSKQVATIELPLKPADKMLAFIKARAIQHLRTQEGDVPACSAVDTWKEADTWSLMHVNASGEVTRSAKTGFLTEQDAIDWQAKNKFKFTRVVPQKKEGAHRRCDGFCPVRDYCDQKKQREALKKGEDE